MANSVKFPFGAAKVVALSATGAQALEITDKLLIHKKIHISYYSIKNK